MIYAYIGHDIQSILTLFHLILTLSHLYALLLIDFIPCLFIRHFHQHFHHHFVPYSCLTSLFFCNPGVSHIKGGICIRKVWLQGLQQEVSEVFVRCSCSFIAIDRVCFIGLGIHTSTTSCCLVGLPVSLAVRCGPLQCHYHRNISSGLLHVSGFHGTFALDVEDLLYNQAYTTDKALIQQLDHGKHGLTICSKDMLNDCPPPYMERLHDLYFDARENHNCTARIKFRVQINQANERFLIIPEELIASIILAFDCKDWW